MWLQFRRQPERQVSEDETPLYVSLWYLVAALVCHSGSVARRRIAHLLWPDTTSARAHGNLRTVIYRLERTCPGLIEASGSSLRLADGLRVDLESTTALANRILTNAGPLPRWCGA